MTDAETPADTETGTAEPEGAPEAAAESAELTALKTENAALREQALRYAAEAENTKRRAEREMNDARAYAIQKFARDLLGVADNLARAIAAAPQDATDPAVSGFRTGVEMTEKELLTAFERNGLKRLEPVKGAKFDPHLHQAVMEQPSDEVAGGGVVQVLQTGYELFGRVVRPAMVVVAAKGSTGPSEPIEPQAHNPYAANDGADEGGAVDTKA